RPGSYNLKIKIRTASGIRLTAGFQKDQFKITVIAGIYTRKCGNGYVATLANRVINAHARDNRRLSVYNFIKSQGGLHIATTVFDGESDVQASAGHRKNSGRIIRNHTDTTTIGG